MSFFASNRLGKLVLVSVTLGFALAAVWIGTPAFAAETATPAAGPSPTNEELKRQLDVLAAEIQKLKPPGGAESGPGYSSFNGYGPAASKVYKDRGLSLGGYGHIVYENYADTTHSGVPVADDEQRDSLSLAKIVFYVGYHFDEHWVFNSEIEFEHKGTEARNDAGNVNVEFAYLDYLYKPELNFRVGDVLIPMGFLNEYHEPTVYLGVHRPDLEDRLIPTTWTEIGLGAFGEAGPFTYRGYFVNGLDASDFSGADGLAEAKQGGGNANAESFAVTGRVDYTGTSGLLAGVSFFVGNSPTGIAPADGGGIAIPTQIYDAHAEYKHRGLEVRAMGVYTFLSKIDQLNSIRATPAGQSPGTQQRGYYVQAGYDVFAGEKHSLIPFVRWEDFNTQFKVPDGFVRDPASHVKDITFGVNYNPMEQIVFKAEYQSFIVGDGSGVNRLSLGAGYIF